MLIFVRYIETQFWIKHTIVLAVMSGWCHTLAAITYVNKFYKPNCFIVVSMALGSLTAVGWCCMQQYYFFNNENHLQIKYLILTICTFYLTAYYFCLAAYMIIDNEFGLRFASIVFFIVI